MIMTKKQAQIIEKHIDIVDMAYRTSSVRGATTEIKNELMDLYVELGYRRQNIACNTCVISYLQTLGALYYQYKSEQEQKVKEQKEQKEVQTEQKHNTKSNGRSKKDKNS